MPKKILGYDLTARRWNEILACAGKGMPIEESGLTLNDEEKQIYENALKEREYWMKKYPNQPFEFQPVELE